MINIDRQIRLAFFLLVAVILFFQFSDTDIWVQNLFYNFQTHSWLIDRDNKILKFIFYSGAKKFLIVLAVLMLFSLIFFRKNSLIKEYKKGILIVVLSAIFVPVTVGALKAITNTPCPKNIKIYGGVYPEIKVLSSYPKDFHQKKRIKCWPAGHASGGFALLALFFLFKTPKNKKIAIFVALGVGWVMGLYKMAIGDHFLSHTVVTMILAWLIILLIVKIVYNKSEKLFTYI